MAKKVDVDWDSDEKEETAPYQFDIPISLHKAVMEKSKNTGVKLAPWMRMHFEIFLDRGVGLIVEDIEQFNKAKNKRSKK